jgi:hypothetical protein
MSARCVRLKYDMLTARENTYYGDAGKSFLTGGPAAGVQFVFVQSAFNRTAVKRRFSFCFKPHFFYQIEIAGKDKSGIPGATLFKKVPNALINGLEREGIAHAKTVFGIYKYDAVAFRDRRFLKFAC